MHDKVELLERLAAMWRAGTLSDDEFQRQKSKLLSDLGTAPFDHGEQRVAGHGPSKRSAVVGIAVISCMSVAALGGYFLSNRSPVDSPSAPAIGGAAAVPASSGDAGTQARHTNLPAGEYAHYYDGSGNASKAQMAEACPAIDRHSLSQFTGQPELAAAWDGEAYSQIIANNGLHVGKSYLDSNGDCRVEVSFAGSYEGTSVNFDKACVAEKITVRNDGGATINWVNNMDCE